MRWLESNPKLILSKEILTQELCTLLDELSFERSYPELSIGNEHFKWNISEEFGVYINSTKVQKRYPKRRNILNLKIGN